MSDKLVPLSNLSDGIAELENKLAEKVKKNNIPSWILVPRRSTGEHADGGAWKGIVMAEASSQDEEAVIDTRIAVKTEDRDRSQSTVGDVPEEIRDPVLSALEEDENADIAIARISYDAKSLELNDIEFFIRYIQEDQDEEVEEEKNTQTN